MVRADIDALPFPDETNPERTVAIHACGHDAHAVIVLTLAMKLKREADEGRQLLRGTIRFVFLPAEETLEGALGMIRDGVLDGVDIAPGLHLRPVQDIPEGTAW